MSGPPPPRPTIPISTKPTKGNGMEGPKPVQLSHLRTIPQRRRWRAFANCRGYPSSWFVGFEEPLPRALELCAECIVREECRENAPARPEANVIYGGTAIEGYMPPLRGGRPRQYECGAPQGRRRHRRNGDLCFKCYPRTGWRRLWRGPPRGRPERRPSSALLLVSWGTPLPPASCRRTWS